MKIDFPNYLLDYMPIIVFLGIAIILSTIILILPLLFAPRNPQTDKLAQYECGFEPVGKSVGKFDVRFYLVAILFIIFDLEIAFLFPWAVTLGKIGLFGFWSMMFFLGVLTIGFIYEWKSGALEWD
jgi:NADH-quinone oxidoreductase subunit A